MAQKKKKKKAPQQTKSRRRLSFSQLAFIVFGVIIILSMVISLVASFGTSF